MSIKNTSKTPSGTETAVPQPTALPRNPLNRCMMVNKKEKAIYFLNQEKEF
jgi:hypothetical protein